MEQQVQTKIKNKLKADGWLVVKLIKTSMNGIPDLLALKDGRAVFIEVKQKGGKASPLQIERINQLRAAGFEAQIWTDYEDTFEGRNVLVSGQTSARTHETF
jgi:Holliday junction resolvase